MENSFARVPPPICAETIHGDDNCMAFALGLKGFYLAPQHQNENDAREYLSDIGLFSFDLMGDLRVVYWASHIQKREFHWARMLANGEWCEKRGVSGVYHWKTKESMMADVERLGYSVGIECRLNG